MGYSEVHETTIIQVLCMEITASTGSKKKTLEKPLTPRKGFLISFVAADLGHLFDRPVQLAQLSNRASQCIEKCTRSRLGDPSTVALAKRLVHPRVWAH